MLISFNLVLLFSRYQACHFSKLSRRKFVLHQALFMLWMNLLVICPVLFVHHFVFVYKVTVVDDVDLLYIVPVIGDCYFFTLSKCG